jgi:citrate synthase
LTNDRSADEIEQEIRDYWRSAIIDMAPGRIRFSGYAIEELMGNAGFADMVWLLTRGELPGRAQAALLEAALVAGVDHGPQAPSIGIARMAITCGVGLNGAMGSAVNVLGDVHGGAGEQCMELLVDIARRQSDGASTEQAVSAGIDWYTENRSRFIPGYGHRFHTPVDPRSPRMLELADAAVAAGHIEGRFIAIGRGVQAELDRRKGKPVPMNIDGATAIVYAELGFPPPLARGLFCLSRSVGILAHAWEQKSQDARIKGTTPKQYIWTYDGPPDRPVPGRDGSD